MREDAHLIAALDVDADVLGVDMEEPVFEFAQRSEIVHVLQDEVRWVEVQAEVGIGKVLVHATPNGRRHRQVLAARPFVF